MLFYKGGHTADVVDRTHTHTRTHTRTHPQFVFNYSSKAAQLRRAISYDLLGLPPDLLLRFRDAIEAIRGPDVLAAAARHLHPAQQVTLVVGDAARVTPQLRAAGLGPITPLQPSD